MQRILQSATSVITVGPFIDDTDFKTLKTGAYSLAAADVILIKAGGTSSAAKNESTAPAFISNGMFAVTVNSTDTATVGRMRVVVVKAASLIVWEDVEVLPATSYNPQIAGTANWTTDISSNIKKNQAYSNYHFAMTLTGTSTPATGKTVAVTRLIDNGSFGGGTLSAVTEVANGIYRVNFLAADLNGNTVTLRATEATCNDRLITIITQP